MPFPTVLFPADPLNDRRVDPEFEDEWAALQFSGVQRATVTLNLEYEVATQGRLFRNLPEHGGGPVVYRGWMLSVQEIVLLTDALEARGLAPVTRSSQYLAAHHLVNWIEIFDGLTPKTKFVQPDVGDAEILAAAAEVGSGAFVVKDWVKSRKDEWDTACYAPNAAALPAIVREFVRLQDDFLVGQVAIREFVELDGIAGEVRTWWVNGQLAMTTGHPNSPAGDVPLEENFLARVGEAVQQLGSSFVTVDMAHRADGGGAIVIEVGDGQVSGLPVNFEPEAYAEMIEQLLST